MIKYLPVLLLLILCSCSYSEINEKTGLPEGYNIWFAKEENGECKYFENEKAIGISLSGEENWALTKTAIDVKPGEDYVVYAIVGARSAGILSNGGFAVGAFLSNKDGVVNWGPTVWGSGNMDWQIMACDVHIPENVTTLTPQIQGHGGGEIFCSGIEILPKGKTTTLKVPNISLPLWSDTKPLSVSLSQEEQFGICGIYYPKDTATIKVGQLNIPCEDLKYYVNDIYGNKILEGDTKYKDEIKFNVQKAGYYEVFLTGNGNYGENISKKITGFTSCVFVMGPKDFKPWSNPFGGQAPFTFDSFKRLNITWNKFICYNLDTLEHNNLPTDFTSYEKIVAEKIKTGILSEFDIKGVEIWNEPENEIPNFNEKWEDLAKTALATTKGVHASYPNCKTLFNICHLGNLTKFHQAGGVGSYDILSLHPYCPGLYNEPKYPQPPEEGGVIDFLLSARSQLDIEGMKDTEIWSTEYGWTTGNLPQGASLLEQAMFTVRSSVLQLACGVKKVNPFRFTDVSFWGEMDGKFGFIRGDKTPKAVVSSYGVMAQTIDDNPYLGQMKLGENIGAFIFGKGKKTVLCLWKFGGEDKINIPIKQKAILRDLWGNDLVFNGGEITIKDEPIYLIYDLPAKSIYSKIKGEFIENAIEDVFVPQSKQVKIPNYNIPYVKNIDINSNWDKPGILLKSEKRFETDTPFEAEVKILTDGEYIFASYSITGSNVYSVNTKDNKSCWNGAGMEFFISLEPDTITKHNKRDCDFQLCLVPGNTGEGTKVCDIWRDDLSIPNSEVLFTKTEKGYEIKAKIPVKYLKQYSKDKNPLKIGDKVKVDFVVNISDENENRAGMLSTHSGTFSQDPSIWGNGIINK